MASSDQIGDFLTRIRNASSAGHRTVDIPSSNLKREISRVLQETGFIRKFVVVDDGRQGIIKILLKYNGRSPVIQGLERVSTPGRRLYSGVGDIPKVINGLGYAILSTPKGVLTDKQSREANVGGEILLKVW
ncbi:MAG: 30S ribosomal protein S8 [Fibrobacteres bacterium]|nr:30S ribosomal protein S8 [Fibrobacterota bacterium]MBK9577866.1 30S ribosomal protein S8 [Fibrobacterota bacterium]QQS06867.1 MAG: 30S ribosomal protein S8 [Fibrobacterota bacterium]